MTASAGDTFFFRSTSAEKAGIRDALRRVRRSLPLAERKHAAHATARKLLRNRRIWRARFVAIYLPMIHELDTRPLIDRLLNSGKRLFVPHVDRNQRMTFTPLKQRRRLRRDALGMQASLCRRPQRSARQFDVMILPLVGFDTNGHRIGMGAGYYDRLLGFQRIGLRPWLVGYAYPQQQVEQLPADPWDIKLDAVALSRGLWPLKCIK